MHDKDAARMRSFRTYRMTAVRSVRAPTLIVLGDQDIVKHEHAVELSSPDLRRTPADPARWARDYLGEAVMTQKPTRYPRADRAPDRGSSRGSPMHDRSPADVSTSSPRPEEAWPRWAAGLARSEVRRDGDEWDRGRPVRQGQGEVRAVVTIHNPVRVVAKQKAASSYDSDPPARDVRWAPRQGQGGGREK